MWQPKPAKFRFSLTCFLLVACSLIIVPKVNAARREGYRRNVEEFFGHLDDCNRNAEDGSYQFFEGSNKNIRGPAKHLPLINDVTFMQPNNQQAQHQNAIKPSSGSASIGALQQAFLSASINAHQETRGTDGVGEQDVVHGQEMATNFPSSGAATVPPKLVPVQPGLISKMLASTESSKANANEGIMINKPGSEGKEEACNAGPATDNFEDGEAKKQGIEYRIVGGRETSKGKYPFMAAIYTQIEDDGPKTPRPNIVLVHFCGGALLAPRWVLTAAHCFCDNRNISAGGAVPFRQVRVSLGEHDLRFRERQEQWFIACKVFIHETWFSRKDSVGDVSMIYLERPAILDEYVQTVALPRSSFDVAQGSAEVAGWGQLVDPTHTRPYTSVPCVLNWATVPMVPAEECATRYNKKVEGGVWPGSHICAGRGDADTCYGDSGGPLICKFATEMKASSASHYSSSYYLCGIVNFGYSCKDPYLPGVYANVAYYLPWIKETMEKNADIVCKPTNETAPVVVKVNCLLNGIGTRVQGYQGYNLTERASGLLPRLKA